MMERKKQYEDVGKECCTFSFFASNPDVTLQRMKLEWLGNGSRNGTSFKRS